MTAFEEARAVWRFWEARRRGDHFPAEWHDLLTFEQAYRIQLGVVARRMAAGERQAGWKVAQTSAAARVAFGYAEPLFGCVMGDGVRRSGHRYAPGTLIQPCCEPELCVRMGRDLSGVVDLATVRQAIHAVFPALEVIEVRGDIAAQKALAIADNAATKDIVLGDAVTLSADTDFAALACRVRLNGEEAAQGRGGDVMGDPLNSVVWLAAKLAEFGLGLRAGELVMTGSITRVFPLRPGDRIEARFDGLGAVAVSCSET